jgi:hypothetical protein
VNPPRGGFFVAAWFERPENRFCGGEPRQRPIISAIENDAFHRDLRLREYSLGYRANSRSRKRLKRTFDYSLHTIASRPAKVGDKLTTTEFEGTNTNGFAHWSSPTEKLCFSPLFAADNEPPCFNFRTSRRKMQS